MSVLGDNLRWFARLAFGSRWLVTNTKFVIKMEVCRAEAAEGGSPGAALDVSPAIEGMLVDSGSATLEGKICALE